MKVFVCSAVKPDRLRTHRWLMNTGAEYLYSVHGDEDKAKLHDLTGIPKERIVVMDPPNIGVGVVSWLRHHLEQEFTVPGEWYAFIDDDIMVSKLGAPWYDMEALDLEGIECYGEDMREEFAKPLQAVDFVPLLDEIRRECIAERTIMGGITWNENYYFRLKKWRTKTFVCGGFCVTVSDPDCPWRFHPEVHLNEDSVRSLFVMEKYGRLVLNQFATIAPLEPTQDNSALGPLERRRSAWKWSCETLAERFSGIVRLKNKPNGDIQLVWKSDKSIKEWRKEQGWLEA